MPIRAKTTALLCTTALVPGLALHAQQPAAKEQAKTKTEPKNEQKEAQKKEAPKGTDVERIIDEGTNHSQVMKTLSMMSDVIGPRLTGSPGLKRATSGPATSSRAGAWKTAHLEPWGPFGKGWTLKGFSAEVVEPLCIPLIAYPKAWSPGTHGRVVADVVVFDAGPTATSTTSRARSAARSCWWGQLCRSRRISSRWGRGKPMASSSTWPTPRGPVRADAAAPGSAPPPRPGRIRPRRRTTRPRRPITRSASRPSALNEKRLAFLLKEAHSRSSSRAGWATAARSSSRRRASPTHRPAPPRTGDTRVG